MSFRVLPNASRRVGMVIATGALLVASGVPAYADDPQAPPPFRLSGFAAEGRGHGQATVPISGAAVVSAATLAATTVSAGPNVDVNAGGSDATIQSPIGGVTVNSCFPGKETPQDETTIAVSPVDAAILVAGANDYRLYEPSENRYDGSGGFFRSTDGGATWMAGLLPGLVRANAIAPGLYEAAGDPSVAAGPNNVFWYANLAFNRTDNANSVAVSRSENGGATWSTSFVLQTSAADGGRVFNDKEWVGADPSNGLVAHVTWTQFQTSPSGHTRSSPIVISNTTDGGAHWSAPVRVSPFLYNQGSVVLVDATGTIHVTYEAYSRGGDVVAYSTSTDGGATFSTRVLAAINDIPSPLPGATFRDYSFPAFARDGANLHVVWSNWNGTNADVLYIRSTDGGASWSSPVAIGGGSGDQFLPWVGSNGGTVFASWSDRPAANDTYSIAGAGSSDGGASWSAPVAISTATSNVLDGNAFGYPTCAFSFIGDYSGITVDANGVAHVAWTDTRRGNDPTDSSTNDTTADQDVYTATLSIH